MLTKQNHIMCAVDFPGLAQAEQLHVKEKTQIQSMALDIFCFVGVLLSNLLQNQYIQVNMSINMCLKLSGGNL